MLTILAYHSIDHLGLDTSITPETFAAQMAYLARHRFRILPLDQVVELIGSQQPILPRCAAITFDDGYRSVYSIALPHLRRYSFPATVFMISGYCGGLSNWPSHALKNSTREMLSTAELRELAASNVTIGAHTVNHPHLFDIPLTEARREIADSRVALEQIVGAPVRHFAYPYGEHNRGLRALVAEHFASACVTQMRAAGPGDDLYRLPRIDAWDFNRWLRLFGPNGRLGDVYLRARAHLRELRRVRVGSYK